MKVYFSICFFFLYLQLAKGREEWIDPHDMNIKLKSIERNNNMKEKDIQCSRSNLEAHYLRNFVQLIIGKIKFDHNSDMYRGHLTFEISQEDYDFLNDFTSNGKHDHSTLEELKTLLKKIFQKNLYDTFIFSVGDFFYFVLYNEKTLLAFSLIGVTYLLWKMQPQKYKFMTLFKIFLPLVYVSDFILRFQALLEKEEVDKYLEQKNYEQCDFNNLNFINRVYNWLTGYCEEKERNFLLSKRAAYHIITPMKVLCEQFDVIVPILKSLGEGFGSFTIAFMRDAPWYTKPLIAAFGFIVLIILLLMFACYALNISPKLSLLHIFHLEFLNKDHIVGDKVQNRDSLEIKNSNIFLENGRKLKKERRKLKKDITNQIKDSVRKNTDNSESESDSSNEKIVEQITHKIQCKTESNENEEVSSSDNEKIL